VTFIFNQTKPYLGENDTGQILLRQARWSAQAFVLAENGEFLHHGLWMRYVPPDRGVLDTFARGLFLLGLLVAAWRWRETALWWIMFLGPVLTVQVFSSGTPDMARGLIAAPFMFLFVGQGIDILLSIARPVAARIRGAYIAVALVLAGAASLSAVTEARAYFDWMNDPAAIAGRQPAVSGEEFPKWQRLQQEAARSGEWGFTVSQWRSRQDSNGCAPGTLPTILCEGLSPGSAERDGQRRANLDRVSLALQEYRGKYGSYPSTFGSIQALCVYPEIDAGCELGEFLKPLPKESLGPPYGYWYESDGSTFTLYTALESPPPGEELCSSKPVHLTGVPYLWCIAGP
jgi:hypothetical protein